MDDRTTLVLGASPESTRYAHMAVERLVANGRRVIAVGKRAGSIASIPIMQDVPEDVRIDTVTLYLNPRHQLHWHDRIIGLRPRRLIFNPGAEDPEFERKATAAGIEVLRACTLVMLATGAY